MAEPIGMGRWLVKKASRRTFALASRLAGLPRPTREGSVRVLMYHRIRRAAREPFSVHPDEFARQMAWLAESGLAISLSTVREHLLAGRRLSRPAVLVTIDDGYRDTYTTAMPILRRHRIPAVAFVSVGCIEDRVGVPAADSSDDAHMSWQELVEVAAAGMAVASHGWDHISLGALDRDRLVYQVTRSREELERRLGVVVDAFAYPFGTRRDFSVTTERALAEAGYRLAFTAQHGPVDERANPRALPRVKVEGGEGMPMFRSLVHGALDGWAMIDRALWRVQAAER